MGKGFGKTILQPKGKRELLPPHQSPFPCGDWLASKRGTFKYRQFIINSTADDDDQIIALTLNGQSEIVVDRQMSIDAMKKANNILIANGDSRRFRVDGETVI